MSPVVVFQYRAKPARVQVQHSNHSSEDRDDVVDEDDDQGEPVC